VRSDSAATNLADKIFRTQANLNFCKKHGIHLDGPRLGKRRYSLGHIITRLQHTSEVAIHLVFLSMNLLCLLESSSFFKTLLAQGTLHGL